MQWRFQSQKRCKDKMKLTRNKRRTMVTSKENERSDQGFVLYRNRKPSWKIPLRLKGSSRCGFSMENNDGLWWLMVAVGDGESSWNFRNGFGRKKEEEMTFFLSYTKAKAEMLK